MSKKHENYEILNLIGYALAKFDMDFVRAFGFSSKQTFYKHFVNLGIVNTTGVIKNRMDLFDNFFNNNRKGWWQKGNAYIHRKLLIDELFGDGYDFVCRLKNREILCEIKGIRQKTGTFRLTQNEYEKAKNFKQNYLLVAVLNLEQRPHFKGFFDPLSVLEFSHKIITTSTNEWHLKTKI